MNIIKIMCSLNIRPLRHSRYNKISSLSLLMFPFPVAHHTARVDVFSTYNLLFCHFHYLTRILYVLFLLCSFFFLSLHIEEKNIKEIWQNIFCSSSLNAINMLIQYMHSILRTWTSQTPNFCMFHRQTDKITYIFNSCLANCLVHN